jgi:DNA polymerase III epsilon subunit-like protein
MRIGHTRKRKQRGCGRTRSRASPPYHSKPARPRSRSKTPTPRPSPTFKKPLSVKAEVFVPSGAASLAAALVTEEAASLTPINTTNNVSADVLVNSIALDCEMVGMKPDNKSALAQIAICDFWGNQLYNEYVMPRGGTSSIQDYRYRYSGITEDLLESKGRPFTEVLREVKRIIAGRTIVGHGLDNDFKVLDITPDKSMVWDTAIIEKYKKPHPYIPGETQPKKLKDLARNVAGNIIQKNERNAEGKLKGHSPLEDARAAMNLYRVDHKIPKITYINMSDSGSPKDDPYFNKLFEMAITSMRK